MQALDPNPPYELILLLVFFVAILYASVGHGGASGYLAILSLFGFPPAQMSTTALILNLFVAGTGSIVFWQGGHFSLRLVLPFILASIPAAFIGGALRVPEPFFYTLLAVALAWAALRLALPSQSRSAGNFKQPSGFIAAVAGVCIGLLSGIVGVGGGIFLSPLMILLRWADPQQTAAASAFFILVNSLAGLAGRLASGSFSVGPLLPLLGVAFLGGLFGSHLGAHRLSGFAMRRSLATVLAIAAGKMVLQTI